MLLKDPKERINVEEALNHPWLLYHLGKIKCRAEFKPIKDKQFVEYDENNQRLKINKSKKKKRDRRKSFRKSVTGK
jgi:hypothetical protein